MPLPRGFVPPCLPTKAPQPPGGDASLHEIKHDGFRVIARKDGDRVRLYSRSGNDLSDRFSLIAKTLSMPVLQETKCSRTANSRRNSRLRTRACIRRWCMPAFTRRSRTISKQSRRSRVTPTAKRW